MDLSNFEFPLKKQFEAIWNLSSIHLVEEMQRMIDRHVRPLEEIRRRIEEMASPLLETERRFRELGAGPIARLVDDTRASSAISAIENLREQCRRPLEDLRYLTEASYWTEVVRSFEPPRPYAGPLELPPLTFTDARDTEIARLEARVEELEERVEQLEDELNSPPPETSEEDDRPFPGQYL